MAPYKRSNPTQLQKERAQIDADQAARAKPKESALGRLVKDVKYRIMQRKARSAGYGAAPQKAGAEVLDDLSTTTGGAAALGRKKKEDTTI